MTKTTIRNVAVMVSLISTLAVFGCSRGDMSDSPATASTSQRQASQDSPQTDSLNLAKTASPPVAPENRTLGHLASVSNSPEIRTRQVIRKAELNIRVKNVEKAERSVAGTVSGVGGYTESATSSDLASDHPQMTLTLRIPVNSFESTIEKFEALGIRLSKKIGSEDVTGHIVDLDAQLKTLKIQADVYRNMLKGRSQLEEVFNIQNQLTQVQTQIEEITSQRKTQAGLAAMSTILLTLEQDAVISQPPADPNWLNQSWAQATSAAASVMRGTAIGLMWIVAFSPFWIVAGLVIRKLTKNANRPHVRGESVG